MSDLPRNIIADRLHDGWSVKDAIETPRKETNRYLYQGADYTLRELSELTGIKKNTIRNYIYQGWTAEETILKINENQL